MQKGIQRHQRKKVTINRKETRQIEEFLHAVLETGQENKGLRGHEEDRSKFRRGQDLASHTGHRGTDESKSLAIGVVFLKAQQEKRGAVRKWKFVSVRVTWFWL